jgi:tetratricopeptide (TPR) repeat protein
VPLCLVFVEFHPHPMKMHLPWLACRFGAMTATIAATIAVMGLPLAASTVPAESWERPTEYLIGVREPLQTAQNDSTEFNPALTYVRRGLLFARSGDFQQAIEQFTLAIEMDPELSVAYGNRGFTRVSVGDNEGAIADFSRALELEPDNPIILASRGITYAEIGDPETALVDLDRSIEINPEFAPTYYNRGLVRIELEDSQGALADLTTTIELNGDFAEAYGARGRLRSDLDDPEGAIADLERAAELFQAQGNTSSYREIMEELERLGAGEEIE